MSRKRLSWMQRNADPFEMNQDHSQPAQDAYWVGDSSDFAEDPHSPLPDDEALGRNEVGHPNMSESNLTHKNVDYWGDDGKPYDNERQANMQREAARDVYARLEKKAYQCVKIATALLPTASENVVEEQAFELMALPDDVVISTAIRLSEEKDEKEEKDDKEDADDEKASEKKEDEEEDEKEKKDKKAFSDPDYDAMLREMISEESEKDDDGEAEDKDEDDDKAEDAKEDGDDAKESTDHEDDEDEELDPEVEAMIADMMGYQSEQEELATMIEDGEESEMQEDLGIDSFDIQLDPTMDVISSDIEPNDEVLRNLFADTVPEQAREDSVDTPKAKQANRGVSTVGGRVKAATEAEGDDNLSKLWKQDPDVSDVF